MPPFLHALIAVAAATRGELTGTLITALATAGAILVGSVFAGVAMLIRVAKDTEAIKGHVNSEKTASNSTIASLRQENALLREMLADQRETAALLAQSKVADKEDGKEGLK